MNKKDTNGIPESVIDSKEITSIFEGIISDNINTFGGKIKDALILTKSVVIGIPGGNSEICKNLQDYLSVYVSEKGGNENISFVPEEIKFSEEEKEKNLAVAKDWVTSNQENPIISLILSRANSGHKLKDPFQIGTGWPTETCANVTLAINLVLEDMKAGFRVKIMKEIKEKKEK